MPELAATVESIDGTLHLPATVAAGARPALTASAQAPPSDALQPHHRPGGRGQRCGGRTSPLAGGLARRGRDGAGRALRPDSGDLAIAVLIRQQHVLNVIFALAGRRPRAAAGTAVDGFEGQSLGGLHVGPAVARTPSLCAFTVVAALARAQQPAAADLTTLALAASLAAVLLVVVLGALPPVDSGFTMSNCFHRFGGWTSVGLFWALTLHVTADKRGAWQIWVLGVITLEHRLAVAQAPSRPGHRRPPVLRG